MEGLKVRIWLAHKNRSKVSWRKRLRQEERREDLILAFPRNAKEDESMFHKVKTSSKIKDAASCFHKRKIKPTEGSEAHLERLADAHEQSRGASK